ncbi:hypothetical protein RB195_019123 [Necator americanus]|uniref:Uncharacterized protein n=1 Tax=Necator americanus TaxID=51031 RepID=A0ABR1CGA2_NECAM
MDFEEKVVNVLDALEVVLPSRSHWAKALSRAHLLRRTSLSNIFVRESVTAAERKWDYELRHEGRLRNEQSSTPEWVVYKDVPSHIAELPRKPMTGNL